VTKKVRQSSGEPFCFSIVKLVGKVVRVSLDTLEIIENLPLLAQR
jgi:hypothetical protein